jgi:hypothetical protein
VIAATLYLLYFVVCCCFLLISSMYAVDWFWYAKTKVFSWGLGSTDLYQQQSFSGLFLLSLIDRRASVKHVDCVL